MLSASHISATSGSEETQTVPAMVTHLFMSFMHALTDNRTLIQCRTILFQLCASALLDSHRCWSRGQLVHWDKTPAGPDGSSAPAAKVSMLHNHSQLVCQVTLRSGCPKVVMVVVIKYEETAMSEQRGQCYCTL